METGEIVLKKISSQLQRGSNIAMTTIFINFRSVFHEFAKSENILHAIKYRVTHGLQISFSRPIPALIYFCVLFMSPLGLKLNQLNIRRSYCETVLSASLFNSIQNPIAYSLLNLLVLISTEPVQYEVAICEVL